MLRRALSSNQHHQNPTSIRWKLRLCYGFLFLVILSIGILILAWKMLCDLPTAEQFLLPEGSRIGSEGFGVNQSGSSREDSIRHSVRIYYEVLCPDSKYFITKDFIPTYEQLRDYIKPIFIPYGKATTTVSDKGELSFECQHGPDECNGNMIHACAIRIITDERLLVEFIRCTFDENQQFKSRFQTRNRSPESIGKLCAAKVHIDWNIISQCWTGKEGPALLKEYGVLTHDLNPPASFIPTISIDGSRDGQKEILKNFKTFVCQKVLIKEKPKSCQMLN